MSRWFAVLVGGMVLLGSQALAQPPAKGKKSKVGEAKKELREARKELREANKEKREALKEKRQQLREARKEKREALREARGEVRETLKEGREKAREAIQEGDIKSAREALQKARKAAREAYREAVGKPAPACIGYGKQSEDATKEVLKPRAGKSDEEWKQCIERFKNGRKARRAGWAALHQGLGDNQLNKQIRQELGKHERRLTYLSRINLLAAEANDKESVGRIEKLIDLENKRHQKKMDMLTSKPTEQKPSAEAEDKGEAT